MRKPLFFFTFWSFRTTAKGMQEILVLVKQKGGGGRKSSFTDEDNFIGRAAKVTFQVKGCN